MRHTSLGLIIAVLGAILLGCPAVSAQQLSNTYWTTANYIAVQGRHPDPGGWIFWTTEVNQWTAQYGQATAQTMLTQYLMSSGEYCGLFGQGAGCINPPSDAQFLTLLYQNALGRQAANDPTGYNWWLSQLGAGVTRAQVVAAFITSSEFRGKYGPYCSTYYVGYANPLSFSTQASISGGTPATVTVTYASAAGIGDIVRGYVQIGSCEIEWDTDQGDVTLAQGGLSNQYCTIVGQDNSLLAGNPNALAVELTVIFSEQNFLGTHEVYSWAENAEGLQSALVDLGALTVNQGPDFTLDISPGDSLMANIVPYGATFPITLTSKGLNGFAGNITLAVRMAPGSASCFVMSGQPGYLLASDQRVITVTNYCAANSGAYINVSGSGAGVTRQLPSVALTSGSTPDFNITVGTPSTTPLTSQTPVSYLVTATPVNYQAGTVALGVVAAPGTTWPAGLTYQFSPPALYLSGNNAVTAVLTFSGSASTPGGTFSLQVIGTLTGRQHIAPLSLSTQVTTFTAGDGPPIKNNASSGEFVGDRERQRAVAVRNRWNLRQVESKDLC